MRKSLCVLLVLCLLLSGSAAAQAAPIPSAVSELYSAEGVYTDDIGNRKSYSYHVPQLRDDTPDAREINAEIAEKYGGEAEDEFRRMEGGFSLCCGSIGWEAFWSGRQLFLLLRADTPNDLVEYDACGYDFETGSRITNEELLEQRGLSEEEYLAALREAARAAFERLNAAYPEERRADGDYEALWERTREGQTMEQPMYIDRDGELAVIAEICVFAGAGRYKLPLRPFARDGAAAP